MGQIFDPTICEKYQFLAEAYRAVFVAEALLREFVRQLLTDSGLDISLECQAAFRGTAQRFVPSGALSKQDDLDACTFGELIQILFGPPGSPRGQRFANKFQELNPRTFRSMLELARETRNAVTHFWPLSQDTIANVREVSRYLLIFLRNMNIYSPRLDELEQMHLGLDSGREDTRDEIFERRYLRCAAIGLPDPAVVESVSNHLSNPAPETAAIMEIPNVLAAALNLRSTILFAQNTTQAFRNALEVIRFHEAMHDPRSGEEGAYLGRVLLRSARTLSSDVGQFVYSDVEHPSLVHMAHTIWPESEIAIVTLSDVLFSKENYSKSAVTEQVAQRYLRAMKRPVSAVVLPHVVWVNGARLDVVQICKVIRDEYPLSTTIVDGAQAVGHLPLNVEKCDKENENIDFYLGCGHKWLRGPETVGFMRVGRRFNEDCKQCRQYLTGNDQLTDASGLALNYKGEQIGTHQRGLAKGLLQALRLLQAEGDIDGLYNNLKANADTFRKIINSIRQLTLLDPPDQLTSAIVAFTLSKCDTVGRIDDVQKALSREFFSVATYPLPYYLRETIGEGDFIRISPTPSLQPEDFSVFESVLQKALS